MGGYHLIETDGYDRDARARVLVGPALDELVEKGSRIVPHFRELVEDLFAVAFKLRPRLVEGPPSAALNHRLLDVVMGADAFAELRASAALEAERSASAALSIARSILSELKKGEALTDEELLELSALHHLEKRADGLEDLKGSLEGEPGADAMRRKIEKELEKARAEIEERSRNVDETLDGWTANLDARVAAAAARAASTLEEDEDHARSFVEKMGADGKTTPAQRLELAETLRGNEKLRRLANLAGAFRRDALAARKKRVRRASSEVHRVGRGADLSHLLPSELSAYVDPRRRRDFLRRWIERDLAAYELIGSDRGGRGPLVICVDGSGSMSGPRELWAKAVSIALLEVAKRQNRRAEAIVFAGREAPLSHFALLPARGRNGGGRRQASLTELLDFAGCFPGGGTDFEKPISAAVDLLRDVRLKGGDLVFVTDGEAPIRKEFVEEIQRLQRQLDFAIYAVLIDDPSVAARRPAPGATRPEIERGARELRKLTDRITTVSRLTSGAVRELFEKL